MQEEQQNEPLMRVPECEALDNEDADVYHSISQDIFHSNVIDTNFIARVSQLNVAEGKVLDIGCGPGQIAIRLAKQNPNLHVTGIDLSERMIEIAKSKSEKEGATQQTHFKVGDAAKLPFEDNSFDMVISHFFIEHLPSEEKTIEVFNEMNRVVKPGGVIYVEDLSRPESESQLAMYMQRVPYQGEKERQNYEDSIRAAFSFAEWQHLVRSSKITFPHTMDPPHIADVQTGLILFNNLPTFQYFSKKVFKIEGPQ